MTVDGWRRRLAATRRVTRLAPLMFLSCIHMAGIPEEGLELLEPGDASPFLQLCHIRGLKMVLDAATAGAELVNLMRGLMGRDEEPQQL
jgi:hypothetical protein